MLLEYQKAIDYIESDEFSAQVAVASNRGTFIKVIGDIQEVKELLVLTLNEGIQKRLTRRAIQLVHNKVDFRYLHKWDFVLATYLYLLSFSSISCATLVASMVLNVPNTYWAKQFAFDVLEQKIFCNDQEADDLKNLTESISAKTDLDIDLVILGETQRFILSTPVRIVKKRRVNFGRTNDRRGEEWVIVDSGEFAAEKINVINLGSV